LLKFLFVERFCNVVVGSGLKADGDVSLPLARREKNYVEERTVGIATNGAADVGTVDAGHHPIKNS
jgi:hypothetical protein